MSDGNVGERVSMTAEEAPAAGYVVFHTGEPGEVIDVDCEDVFVLEDWQ